MSGNKNVCTICGKPSIPGMMAGEGKCQYHWNVATFGQAWADNIEAEKAAQQEADKGRSR